MRNIDYLRVLFLGFFLLSCTQSHAVDFQTPESDPGLLTLSPFFASLFSLSDYLEDTDNSNGSTTLVFTLPDGAKVEGFLFADNTKGPRPLIIADFGLMSSRWSGFAGQLIKTQYETGNVNANFLILDDMTSSSFYINNGNVGIGGYEAGKILLEIADAVKEKGVPYSSLHLLGESLGGLAVQQALIEDHRLGTKHFQSALTISAVVDEMQSTGAVFKAFGHDLPEMESPELPKMGHLFLAHDVDTFNDELDTAKSVLPRIDKDARGDFFYNNFTQRLTTKSFGSEWNPDVSHNTFENYVETSAALLSQIDQIDTPIMFLNAKDDPIIAHEQFESFAKAHESNPKILTHETGFGSHCGLPATYGVEWTTAIMNQALSLQ